MCTRKRLFCAEMKVNTCTNFVVGLSTEEGGEINVLALFRVSL